MKGCAKWVVIVWSILCLLGIVIGMANVGDSMNKRPAYTDAEKAGQGIGIGCGLGMWVFAWAAVALPAFIIFVITGGNNKGNAETRLCNSCGKYYEGQPKFCPNCGKTC